MQMFDEMHARNCIDRSIRPRQPFPLEICPAELATHRLLLRLARLDRGKETQVRTQLGKMAKSSTVRRSQIQQRRACRQRGHKPRPRIKPRERAKPGPVHNLSNPALEENSAFSR